MHVIFGFACCFSIFLNLFLHFFATDCSPIDPWRNILHVNKNGKDYERLPALWWHRSKVNDFYVCMSSQPATSWSDQNCNSVYTDSEFDGTKDFHVALTVFENPETKQMRFEMLLNHQVISFIEPTKFNDVQEIGKMANFYFSDNWYTSSSTQVSNVTYRALSFDESDFHYLLLQNRRVPSQVADENSSDSCYSWDFKKKIFDFF